MGTVVCHVNRWARANPADVSQLGSDELQSNARPPQPSWGGRFQRVVVTENSVRSENTGVRIIREIMVATTMSSLFVALFALLASSFRTRAALQAEILALRHQLAVFQKNGPRRLRLHRCDRLLWVLLYRFWSGWRRCLAMVQPDTVIRCTAKLSPGIGPENRAAFPAGQKLRPTFVI